MFHSFLLKLNIEIEKRMPLLTPTGVVVGFLLGTRISEFAPAVTYLFAFITFSGALGMNIKDFAAVLKKPLPIFSFLIAFHIIIPLFIRLVAGLIFSSSPEYVTGFVLLFSIPTAVAGYIWTAIHYGNEPLALTLILIDTLLAPILTPFTISFLMNTSVAIDTTGMFLSLVLMVVLPSIIGISLNQASKGKITRVASPFLKPLSKIFLFCVIAINAARVAPSIQKFEKDYVLIIITCIFLSFAGYAIGAFTSKIARLSRNDSVSIMYAVGMRNISAALVLAIQFFPPKTAIPVITGILFQQTLAALAGVVIVQKHANNDNSR